MQNVSPEAMEHPYVHSLKVHGLLCLELKKLIDRIAQIFTAIESELPRCKSGIQALCQLHLDMEKSTLLLRHCSESSKFYLAINGDSIVLRCERIRFSLESHLSQLQNMVQPTLAAQISQIVDDVRNANFVLDSSEDEAGKVLLTLLHQDIAASKSAKAEESKAFRLAASRLHITTPIAVLIEKRSIKILLGKIPNTEVTKQKILNYFLYLLRKYGKSLEANGQEPEDDDVFDFLEPPVKFRSPQLNKIYSSCSSSSISSSLEGLQLQVSNVSFRSSDTDNLDGSAYGLPQMQEKFDGCQSSPNINIGVNLFIIAKLSALPWAARRKAVEDVKDQLEANEGCDFTISTSYIKPVIKFLKDAQGLHDSGAKRHGAELLLIFLKECRNEVPPFPKDAFYVLSSFLDSEITEEALEIVEVLSRQDHYKSEMVRSGILYSILGILKNPRSSYHQPTMRVLCNLSSHADTGHHMIHLDYIPKLVPFLDDILLAGYCIKIFKNLCYIEEAAAKFIESENCVTTIVEILEVGSDEEQELAAEILLSLCHQYEDLRVVLMQDDIISSLVNISKNGTSRGKLIALELLQLLGDVPSNRSQESNPQSSPDKPREKKSCPKSSGLSSLKISRLTKLRL